MDRNSKKNLTNLIQTCIITFLVLFVLFLTGSKWYVSYHHPKMNDMHVFFKIIKFDYSIEKDYQ